MYFEFYLEHEPKYKLNLFLATRDCRMPYMESKGLCNIAACLLLHPTLTVRAHWVDFQISLESYRALLTRILSPLSILHKILWLRGTLRRHLLTRL